MELLGHFKGHTEAQEGTSRNGNAWRKVVAVFETVDKYPVDVAVTCMNNMCETAVKCIKGKLYRVRFDIESRPWTDPKTGQEKWFTDAKAWGIQLEVPAAVPGVHDGVQTVPATEPAQQDNGKDDLPF